MRRRRIDDMELQTLRAKKETEQQLRERQLELEQELEEIELRRRHQQEELRLKLQKPNLRFWYDCSVYVLQPSHFLNEVLNQSTIATTAINRKKKTITLFHETLNYFPA